MPKTLTRKEWKDESAKKRAARKEKTGQSEQSKAVSAAIKKTIADFKAKKEKKPLQVSAPREPAPKKIATKKD